MNYDESLYPTYTLCYLLFTFLYLHALLFCEVESFRFPSSNELNGDEDLARDPEQTDSSSGFIRTRVGLSESSGLVLVGSLGRRAI